MTVTTSTPARTSGVRVAVGILAAAVLAILADTLIALIAHALGAAADFRPLQFGAFAFFTVVGTLAAAAGWAIIRRAARRPATALRRTVPAVLLVSIVPDLLLLGGDMPGVSGLAVGALILMHVAVVAVVVSALRIVLPVADRP